MINFEKVTYGCEYEFGDVWRKRSLPDGLVWNTKDYSIVSSTGIANDPKGLVYSRGGEINSNPTETIDEQLEYFEKFLRADLSPRLNHRTNLHLHIRVPGLSEDVDALKKLLKYVDKHQTAIYAQIEPVPVPSREDFDSEESYKGAVKRYRRRLVSHQYKVPADRVKEALSASTPGEFFDAHSKLQSNGKRAYGLTTRAGINFLQLKETDTIEFRHFSGTLSAEELLSCFTWVKNFVPAALGNATVPELLASYNYKFPAFSSYCHDMEIGYQFTNFDKLSRKVATSRIDILRTKLDIEACSAKETVDAIKKIEGECASQGL